MEDRGALSAGVRAPVKTSIFGSNLIVVGWWGSLLFLRAVHGRALCVDVAHPPRVGQRSGARRHRDVRAFVVGSVASIPLSPRVHIRAVALDLLTEALHPSSRLKPYILQLATLLWEDSSAVHLLCSATATDILPETEALLLQGSAQLSWHLSGICAVSTTSAYHRLCAHMIAYFVVLVIQIAGLECFVRGGCHTRHFCEPTWVPSPGAVPSDIAYCSEWFEDTAADWFDIDYSAFVYDRDFEEELCIEDFSHDFLEPAPGLVLNAGNRPQASEAWTAQAHHDQPDSASHQYATFFAQTAGAADARVAGDIIDPAEAPVNRPVFHYGVGRSEMIDTNVAPTRRLNNLRASAHCRELDQEWWHLVQG